MQSALDLKLDLQVQSNWTESGPANIFNYDIVTNTADDNIPLFQTSFGPLDLGLDCIACYAYLSRACSIIYVLCCLLCCSICGCKRHSIETQVQRQHSLWMCFTMTALEWALTLLMLG